MDSQFSLELPNASTSRDELGALRRGQAVLKSAVDSLLPAPAVHGLVADTQVAGDLLDAASGRDKVQHPLTKLRGVTASSHAVLPCLGGTAAWSIPIIRLQEIQGALPRDPRRIRTPSAPARPPKVTECEPAAPAVDQSEAGSSWIRLCPCVAREAIAQSAGHS